MEELSLDRTVCHLVCHSHVAFSGGSESLRPNLKTIEYKQNNGECPLVQGQHHTGPVGKWRALGCVCVCVCVCVRVRVRMHVCVCAPLEARRVFWLS